MIHITIGREHGEIPEYVSIPLNEDASAEHFSLDPREQLAAVKDMRERGGSLRGTGIPLSRPPAEDVRLAFDKNATYLILSLADETPALNAFHVEAGKARKEFPEIMD